MLRTMALAATLCVAAALAPATASADEFYKGKTVTYVVATNPGGGYDTYGRLVAKYMEKHLPGSKFVVRNVPGAGHIVGANTVYAARPDGLTIGTFNTGLIYTELLKREGARFELGKMTWIGKAASDVRALVISKNAGFADFAAMAASPRPVKMAAAGIGSASYADTKILTEALGMKVQLVPGFEGTEAEMSMLRGEVGALVATASSLEAFVGNGHARFALAIATDPTVLPGVPRAAQFVKDQRGRDLLALIEALSEIGRLTAGPPGIPAERTKALRDAFMAAMADPDLLEEAKKINAPIEPADGERVAGLIRTALAQPPETVALLKDAMGAK